MGNEPIVRQLSATETVTVPRSSAGRKVLCKRHNSALTDLDQLGRRFVAACKEQRERAHIQNSPDDSHILFNGYDVERWMLKVLCASSHGGPISRRSPSPKWTIPRAWVEVLFHGRSFPKGAGLYLPEVRRGRFDRGMQIAIIVGTQIDVTRRGRPLLGSGRPAVVGIAMCLYGSDLDFLMAPPADPRGMIYRARMHRLRSKAGGIAHVHLGWDDAPPTFAGKGAVQRLWSETKDGLLR